MSKFKRSKILCVALIIAIIATVIAPLGSFTAFADTQGDYTYTVADGEATLTKYTGSDKNVAVPSTLGGYPVTTIAPEAFGYNETIVSITLPDTVKSIEMLAFTCCNNLTTINLSDGITYISSQAFYYLPLLANINLPDSITYLGGAFWDCDNLTSITLPKGIDTLIGFTFQGCDGLTIIDIPENITTIKPYAINECHGLTTINIPKTVSLIDAQSFYYCENLTQIVVSEENPHYSSEKGVLFTKDKKSLIRFPQGKKGEYTVPDSVTSIEQLAFSHSFKLTDVKIGKQVVLIDHYAFQYSGLKNITIPENVTSFGKSAFAHCENLTVYAKTGSVAYQYAVDNNINVAELVEEDEAIKDVSHEIVDDKIIFTVTTGAGDYNRVKVTFGDDIKGYIAYTNSYTVNDDGDYVWTIKTDAPTETTNYAFDIRSNETGKYIREYYYYKAVIIDYTNDKTTWGKVVEGIFTSSNGGLRMDATGWKTYGLLTISMVPEDYNNVGLTNGISVSVYAADPADVFAARTKESFEEILSAPVDTFEATTVCGFPAYKAYVNGTYYAWIINTPLNKYFINFMQADGMESMQATAEQMMSTVAIFDGKDEDPVEGIKSVSHEISNGKIIFTVTTGAGEYNRVKATLADDLKGYVAYSSSYTVNTDGDYVWTIKADAPKGTTNYAFDIRSDETGKYIKEYFSYDVEVVEPVDIFKSVTHEISNGKIIFTVTTTSGDYNRIKVTSALDPKGYIAYSNDYTINADGDYVWTIKANIPSSSILYSFDLRSNETGKYIREYFEYPVEVVSAFKSISHEVADDKIIFTVVTDTGYNRVKVVLADDLKYLVAFTSTYTLNDDGDCVWIMEIDAPAETTLYAFDLRLAETNAYIRGYRYCEV